MAQFLKEGSATAAQPGLLCVVRAKVDGEMARGSWLDALRLGGSAKKSKRGWTERLTGEEGWLNEDNLIRVG